MTNRAAVEQDSIPLPQPDLQPGELHRSDPASTAAAAHHHTAADPDRPVRRGRGPTVPGVSWPTAHAAFVSHAESVLGEPAPVAVLRIDETRPSRRSHTGGDFR